MPSAVVPESGDVIVRRNDRNPSIVYLLGTSATPDQFIIRTREEAISQALAFAKQHNVRAWFAKGDDFVLLGTFREESGEPERPS